MNDKEFCPNCGKPVSKSDDFCQNCGYALKQYRENNKDDSITQPKQTKNHQQTQQNTPITHNKKKSPLIPIILVVVILIAAYLGGNWYFSKSRQSQVLADNMTSGVTSRMASAAVTESGSKISESDLKPLSNLYIKDSSTSEQVKNSILKDSQSTNFKVAEVGKYLGLFPKYKVVIVKQAIEIETNIDNPSFKLNGKSISSRNDDGEYKLSKRIPGLYKVSVSGKKTKQVIVPVAGEADEYTINEANISDDDEDDVSTTEQPARTNRSSRRTYTPSKDDEDEYYEPSDDDETFLGSWTNDTSTVTFNDDGTYSLDDKTGTYKVNSWHGDQVSITYYEDGKSGPGWTATYTLDDDSLELNSNHMTWYR